MSKKGKDHFEFILGKNTDAVQYLVKVYCPVDKGPISGRTTPGHREKFMGLWPQLNPVLIAIQPNPTRTLVSDGGNTQYRIDSQPADMKWRNIQYQEGRQTFAAVTVDQGAELCYVAGTRREIKLLKYVMEGLRQSYGSGKLNNIKVTVQRREKRQKQWPEDLVKIGFKAILEALKTKNSTAVLESTKMAIKYTKNSHMILQGTDMIEHVAAAIERNIAKMAGKEAGEMAAKKIPIISMFLGAFLAVQRAYSGDYKGAMAEAVSGLASTIPGAGTAASVGIDATLLARDIEAAVRDERKHKKLLEVKKERLKQENVRIREELKVYLPESPIYGGGRESKFDEFELGITEDIIQIKVRCGDLIDAVQVVYKTQSGKQHGGGGGSLRTFNLSPDEKITFVSGTTTNHGDVISSLTFGTDYGRQEMFGIKNGEEFEFEMTDGAYLGAIKGYDAYGEGKSYPKLLPAIGFIPKF